MIMPLSLSLSIYLSIVREENFVSKSMWGGLWELGNGIKMLENEKY
jgi:hypothetical protein